MFSIIVPVYNTEKFLQKCIDSLVGQTFKDIEIILVNDCSTDGSLHVIEENMKQDSRIKLVNHDVNKKAHQARRSGFLASTHDYILFVDSDDYFDVDCCEKLANILSKKHYDIIQFEGIMVYQDSREDKLMYNFDKKFNRKEYFDNEIFEEMFVNEPANIVSLCSKCSCRYLVQKSFDFIGDTELFWFEDWLQSFIMSYYAKSIIFVEDIVYNYIQHGNNSFENMTIDKYSNHFFSNHMRLEYLIQSFIKQEQIDKRYPVIKEYDRLSDAFKNITESILISDHISKQTNMFSMYRDKEKIIFYIFFIKITIKLKSRKK